MQQRTTQLARLAMLLALTLSVQMLGLPPIVTGPMVNLFLILTVLSVNTKAAVILGMITPLVALWRGELPVLFDPVIPFVLAIVIITGNIVLSLVFGNTVKCGPKPGWDAGHWLRQILSAILASGAKYLVMALGITTILPALDINLPEKLIFVLTTSQLITALEGSIAAILLYRFFQRIHLIKN